MGFWENKTPTDSNSQGQPGAANPQQPPGDANAQQPGEANAQQTAGTNGEQSAQANPPPAPKPKKKPSPTPSPAPPANGGQQPSSSVTLASLVKADLWRLTFYQPDVALLVLHIQQAGGGYETKSNIWTFFGGARIYYSGGSISTYTLLSPASGAVLAAGSCPAYTGNVRPKEISSTIESAKGPLR